MKIHVQKFCKVFLFAFILINSPVFALKVTQESLDSLLSREENAYVFPERHPNEGLTAEDLIFESELTWPSSKTLTFRTRGNIIFEKSGKLAIQNGGSLSLEPGMEAGDLEVYPSTVTFKGDSPQVVLEGGGKVRIFYNPKEKHGGSSDHKYHHPVNFDFNFNSTKYLSTYMLVNDVNDLQGMRAFPSGNYALGQNVDASMTREWNTPEDGPGEGFTPVGHEQYPFSGDFEGNSYTISNLYINRPTLEHIGLFGYSQRHRVPNKITNLNLKDVMIVGKNFVGALIGSATLAHVHNVKVSGQVSGKRNVGGVIGSIGAPNPDILDEIQFLSEYPENVIGDSIELREGGVLKKGRLIGVCAGSQCDCCAVEDIGLCHEGTACHEDKLKFQETLKGLSISNQTELKHHVDIIKQLINATKCPEGTEVVLKRIDNQLALCCL